MLLQVDKNISSQGKISVDKKLISLMDDGYIKINHFRLWEIKVDYP